MKRNNLSACCKAEIEKDLGGIGVFTLTSGSLVCTKCKKYCYYMPKSVSTQSVGCMRCNDNSCPSCENIKWNIKD